MNQTSVNFLKAVFKQFGVGVTRYSELERLREGQGAIYDLEFLQAMQPQHVAQVLACLKDSKAQLRQDLLALALLDFKQEGYFVEFGATNGVDFSNSYLLETRFGWRGILAEPSQAWQAALKKNRKAHIETKCVWTHSGQTLQFKELAVGELSTIEAFSGLDYYKSARRGGKVYPVDTISLNDLLDKYDAPESIDYLSIDTEGSEYEILRHFDFSRRHFKVITCEHNFSSTREPIHQLLTQHGYSRRFEALSRFDDWYVRQI